MNVVDTTDSMYSTNFCLQQNYLIKLILEAVTIVQTDLLFTIWLNMVVPLLTANTNKCREKVCKMHFVISQYYNFSNKAITKMFGGSWTWYILIWFHMKIQWRHYILPKFTLKYLT